MNKMQTKKSIKALENYFEIRCKKCNSTDVTLDYYSGIVSDCGMYSIIKRYNTPSTHTI